MSVHDARGASNVEKAFGEAGEGDKKEASALPFSGRADQAAGWILRMRIRFSAASRKPVTMTGLPVNLRASC
jgi:hypothetical protein